jgi:peptide/nickel transport system substrate-binding protein
MSIRALLVALALITTTPPAWAENVLRWASAADALTFDPHAVSHQPTLVENLQVYEPLVDIDPGHRIEPALAMAWRLVAPTVWEFELRQGVRFHDGTPLTAGDVAFSLRRVTSGTGGWAESLWPPLTSVEAVGGHVVRIETAQPSLILPAQLADILIMSRAWAERHGAIDAAPFDDAEVGYVERHANGTGPFQLESFEPGVGTVMTRNPSWWGLGQEPHGIDRLVRTKIVDGANAAAALREGRIDLWTGVPPPWVDELAHHPGIKVERADDFFTIFFGLDQGSAELRSSNVKGRNPFKDRRVRRAVYQAIDIEAIRQQVMRGYARPAGMLVAPGINGWSEELDRRLPYDPAAARRLLTEAGYPDGFAVTLDCPNDRYVNDATICQAVAGALGRVGIAVTVEARTMREHVPKVLERRTDFYMLGWSPTAFDSYRHLVSLVRGSSRFNATGYADPEVDGLIEKIGTEVSTYVRDAMIEQVWRRVGEEVVYVPLHHEVAVWAMRDGLELAVDPYGGPRFRKARFRSPPEH